MPEETRGGIRRNGGWTPGNLRAQIARTGFMSERARAYTKAFLKHVLYAALFNMKKDALVLLHSGTSMSLL